MKQPSATDRVVKVRAYLTDETFGYDHWRAAQFAPSVPDGPWAVLVICDSKEEQDRVFRACGNIATPAPEGEQETPEPEEQEYWHREIRNVRMRSYVATSRVCSKCGASREPQTNE